MNHSFTGFASAEGHHEREPLSFVEIPLTEVPEAVGQAWKNEDGLPKWNAAGGPNKVYLTRFDPHKGEHWRSVFTHAYRVESNPEEPHETIYALVDRNLDLGEFISFATMENGTVINSGLFAFFNKHPDNFYKNEVIATYIETDDAHQKKGVGTRVLQAMNDFSIQRWGKSLHSEFEFHHKPDKTTGVRPGWKTWKSLFRDGLVERYDRPEGVRFKFPTPEGSEEKGRFTF